MHPNMKKLLGINVRPVFHAQTWPTPVDVPATSKKEGK
jgi:hypothetical protein